MRFAIIAGCMLLSGCGAAVPMVLSGVAGGLTIAKDVLDVDVSLRQLIMVKREMADQCPSTPSKAP